VPLYELRGVKKAFDGEVVFEHVDLDVHEGEILTLMGESGSGKSLLLKMLVGLIPPDEGTLKFDGQEVGGLSEHDWIPVRRRIGMTFQEYALFDSMTVADNVAYGLREQGRPEEEIANVVRRGLRDVGLPGIEEMAPKDLSGGMKKRVGLARAMAMQPDVVLYDEPTEGLDPINVTRVRRLMLGVKERGVTSVTATHDMRTAFTLSDRLALLHEGRVAVVGTPDELRASDDPRLEAYVRSSKMRLPTPSQIPPAPES